MRSLTFLDYMVIVVYLAGLSAIGFHYSRRQRTSSDFFLAGRRLHWLLVGGSIMATLLSTISYLSVPGEMIRYGVGFLASVLAIPLVIPIVAWVLVPVFARLNVTSAYEYLETRFNSAIRSLAASVFLVRTTIWMGLIIYTTSLAFQEVTGWSFETVVLVVGLFTTVYSSSGGFQAVVWTDNLQLLVLLGGLIAIPLFVAISIGSGPFTWWADFSLAGRAQVQIFSLDPRVRITMVGIIIDIFFYHLCTNGGDQVVIQRYLSTPSVSAARRSLLVYGIANMLLVGLLMFTGLALFAYYFAHSNADVQVFQETIAPRADRLMPALIARELPSGVSALLLAALLAAAMSSVSSGINSASGVVINDFLRLWPKLKKFRRHLLLERVISAGAGIMGILSAYVFVWGMSHTGWNLVEVAGRVNNLLIGPLASLFFAGILLRNSRPWQVFLGFLLGMGTSLSISFGGTWIESQRQVSFMWIVPASFSVAMATTYVLTQARRGLNKSETDGNALPHKLYQEEDEK